LTKPLSVPRDVARQVLAHARAELPNEACGLLSGSLADATVRAYHPARNVHASPLRFSVHPEDLVRITYAIDGSGQDLVAVFHSHPRSDAVPSPADLREATHPDAYYLIASLAGDAPAGGELRAWLIRGERATEADVRLA
jgi:proteasome lid subunit RPN8/RPN11